jgi:hypothetical protein
VVELVVCSPFLEGVVYLWVSLSSGSEKKNDVTLHGALGCQISASTETLVRWNWRATSIKYEADRVPMFVAASGMLWLLWLCSGCVAQFSHPSPDRSVLMGGVLSGVFVENSSHLKS